MKYFLDTNIIIYALKGKYPSLPSHFRQTPSQSIVIPAIVMAEIEYGARKSTDYDQTIQLYRQFTDPFIKMPFSDNASITYGIIRSRLEATGSQIGPNDMIIAATVLSEKGILVTHNTREFARISELQLEDWTV